MPSETELAERYGVSRMTAGKVLGPLATEGLIQRRCGAGSVVAQQIGCERVAAGPGALISVRLPTASERAAVRSLWPQPARQAPILAQFSLATFARSSLT